MKKVEFICTRCGTSFTVEADYVITGVQGFCNGLTFVDPTEPRHCPTCTEEMIAEITDTIFDDYFIDDEGNLMWCERPKGSAKLSFDDPQKEVSVLSMDLDNVDITREMEMLDEYYATHDPYHEYKAGRVFQMMKEKGFMP